MAIAASFADVFLGKPCLSPQAMGHLSKAYSLVNQTLSKPEPVSDECIAAVVSLGIYQRVHQEPSAGSIHMAGLYEMIQLRGGMTSLFNENRALAQKIWRYVDWCVTN